MRWVDEGLKKQVYLPPDLIEKVNRIIEKYGPVLRIRSFSEATEDALRKWVVWIKKNEDVLRGKAEELGYA